MTKNYSLNEDGIELASLTGPIKRLLPEAFSDAPAEETFKEFSIKRMRQRYEFLKQNFPGIDSMPASKVKASVITSY